MARPKLEAGTETVRMQIVAPATFVERIDEWRSRTRPIVSRAEAIRILVDMALNHGDRFEDYVRDVIKKPRS